ncbi:MAG: methyltransferase domain-containing protein [Candidatus Thermoplasmatota archaeon]|nr:methyltransferase domain-containing protein [Candidatus Thermoplasmatota archaeon]
MQSENRVIAQKIWDTIAESFDTTRQKPWSNCLEYIHSLNPTDIVADIGCGNGRHLLPCAEQCKSVFGVDVSSQFLQIVQKKLHHKLITNTSLIHADAVYLPFTADSFDAILFIASLHNIKGKDYRHQALTEVARVLKPQGTALISVWSRWQDKYCKYFLKQLITRKREFGDIEVCWRQHHLNVPRFYHLYAKGEFLRDLQSAGFQIQRCESVKICSKRFPDNYFALVRKR